MAGLRAIVAAQDAAKAAAREAAIATAVAASVPAARAPGAPPRIVLPRYPHATVTATFDLGFGEVIEERQLTPEEVDEYDRRVAHWRSPEGAEELSRDVERHRVEEERRRFARDPWGYASRRANRDDLAAAAQGQLGHLDLREVARTLCAQGWSWLFQSVGDGGVGGPRRVPVGGYPKKGKLLKGGGRAKPHPMAGDDATPSTRAFVRTTIDQGMRWAHTNEKSNLKSRCNVAFVAGPATGLVILDNDCDDPERGAIVKRIRDEELGVTPYLRTRAGTKSGCGERDGAAYRMTSEEAAKAGNATLKWKDSDDEVEFFVQGKCWTVLGWHHKTAMPFEWSGPVPGFDPEATPDLLPWITAEQVERCLARMQAECPGEGSRKASRTRDADDGDVVPYQGDTSGFYRPKLRIPKAGDDQQDPIVVKDGKVVSGIRRHFFLVALDVLKCNPAQSVHLLGEVAPPERAEAEAALLEVIMEVLDDTTVWTGKTSRASVRAELDGDLVRLAGYCAANIRSGRSRKRVVPPGSVIVDARPQHHAVLAEAQTIVGVDSIRTLMANAAATKLRMELAEGEGPDARALLDADGMAAQRVRVADEVRRPTMAWLDAVWDKARGVRKVSRKELVALQRAASEVVLLKAPTGAGKTQTLLTCVLDQILARGKIGPLLFMAPSYLLLDDVTGRLDGIAAEAEKAATDDAMKAAAAMGLKTMVYQGKSRLCTLPQGRILADAGLSPRGLCEGHVERRDMHTGKYKREPVECKYKATCRAWTQIPQIAESDIVFLPTAYVSLPVPKELKACVGLVVDESVAGRFLRGDTMAVESLSLARREPFVSKAEQEAGMTSDVYVRDREQVADVVRAWALRNVGKARPEDLGQVLLDYEWAWGTKPEDRGAVAMQRVSIAQNCVGRGLNSFRTITPAMSEDEARELARSPRGTDAWPEWRTYDVALDRMQALHADRLAADLAAEGGTPAPARTARGAWDHRLQVTQGPASEGKSGVRIRVSWRAKNSFSELPTLLMDASANAKMVEKLWKGREVRTVTVAARMHMRVVAALDVRCSDSSMQPWRRESPYDKQQAATMACRVREVVDAVSALHGNSQVVVASTKSVEVALNTKWRPWANVSWLHFGACVGLDFAKAFPAAVIVGRQELPAAAIDMQVGALTYDDPEPELPVDLLGTGCDAEGNGLRTPSVKRLLKLRSGQDVILAVPVHAGAWAAAVQAQAREEQLMQAIGRLRPVYREGEPPVVVLIGNVVPEGLIVDAVCRLEELDVALGKVLRAGDGLRAAPAPLPAVATTDPRLLAAAERAAAFTATRLRGLVRHAYVRADGTEHEVDVVAPEVGSVAELVERHERAAGHGAPTGLREVSRGAPLDGQKPREPDEKMLLLVGTPEQQRAAERESLELARLGDAVPQVTREGEDVVRGEAAEARTVFLDLRVVATMQSLARRPLGNVNAPVAAAVEQVVEAAPEAVPQTLDDMLEGLDPQTAFAA